MVLGKAPVSSRTAEVPQERSDTLSHGRSATIAAIATGALAMVLVLTVAAYAYLGRFTRYVADDYTRKNDLRVRGFWASQVWEYLHWTGRFVSIAVIDAGLLLNEVFVRLLPGLLLLLWVVAICAAAKALVPTIGLVGRITLALAVVVTTVEITPNPFLSLYWMSGSLAYIPCLLLGTVFVALAASRHPPSGIRFAAAGLLTLLAGGFNEGYAIAQLTLLLLALAATWVTALPALRRSRCLLVSGCAGSVLSLAVLGAAPGNGVRFGVITEIIGARPSLLALPGVTIGFAAQFLNEVFVARWLAVLAAGAMVALVAARTPATSTTSARRGFLMVAFAVFAALIALVGSFVSTAYVEARITPIYAQIVPVFIGVCAVAIVGWGCGRYVGSWCARVSRDAGSGARWRSVAMASSVVAIAGLAAAVPVQSVIGIWDDRGAFSAYAAVKDTEAALAQSAGLAGRASVVVPATSAISNLGIFSHSGFEEMIADPAWWINKGEATYYGVGSISAQR
jgi:hypothetical protein